MDQKVLDILEFNEIRKRVAAHCSFAGGRERIEDMEPSDSLIRIRRQLEYTKAALDCTNAYGPMPFLGIREIRPAVSAASKGSVLSIDELQAIAQHSSGVRACIQYSSQAGEKAGVIEELTSTLSVTDALSKRIWHCITADGNVADHASEELAKIRRSLKQQSKDLDSAFRSYVAAHSSELMEGIVATRSDRHVVLARTSHRNRLGGIQYDESASGAAVYLEPAELVPFNNAVQNTRRKEAREVERILRELSGAVAGYSAALSANMETLSLLDELFAKAAYGHEIDGVTPVVTDGNDLVIKQGWHPLLDQRKAVRNTYRLCDPYRILLISGPNTGGKTVSLKTMGLFALMAYAGLPVAAEEATIPLYDDIFVDIGDSQSIAESLSTFSAHMAILADIFRKADSRSLVIIDELASGTDPKEGENLAIAVLEHFRDQNVFFIGSTHYEKLKTYARDHSDVLIASMTFDMEKLEPTYHYREGLVGESNAFDIAARYGFPASVIKRARRLKQDDQTDLEKLMEKLSRQEALTEDLNEKLNARLEETTKLEEKLKNERQNLADQRADLLEEARREAADLLEEKMLEADLVIEELKKKSEYKMPEVIAAKGKITALKPVQQEEEALPADNSFREGDIVRIVRSQQVGTITRISGQKVTLDVHGMTVRTTLDGLRKEKSLPKPKKVYKEHIFANTSFPSEVNLIGLRVAEALPILDKYLDDAILHHCAFVRVIHGFGTGKLRTAVWDALKRNRNVERYEMADGSEGGGGATIVHFRKG